MKRLTFVLILIAFFLIFSYSKPIITAQAVDEEQYLCDENNTFHFPGGTYHCTEGCDSEKGCCGAPREHCCGENNSYGAECMAGATCVNRFCEGSGTETPDEIPDESADKSSRTEREINEENCEENCNSISCADLDEDSCLAGDNVYCCDWDRENEILQPMPGCGNKEKIVNSPICKNKPEPLIKI